MVKNYLKIALRNIRKHKAYSLINVFGLAIGMACTILILLFVQDELSYDRFHNKADRIYRVTREWFNDDGSSSLHLARVAPPIGPLLENDFPNIIEDVVRIRSDYNTLLKLDDKTFVEKQFFWAEANVFHIFSFLLLKGNPATALKEPNSVVLTEEMAEKYFGSQDPIGQTITHENERELKVTGVVKNIPENSHFKFDFLGSFGTLNDIIGTKLLTSNWGRNNYLTYVLLRKGISPDVLREKIPGFLDRHIGQLVVNSTGHPPSRPPSEGTLLYLQKLTDIHLHSHLTTELEQNGDITNVYLFTTIALFILLIACINFMNLATARSAKRAREIGLRKVLGAYRKQLIQQFLGESIYISLMAMFLAIVFVEVALPYYNDFTGKSLSLAYWDNPLIIVGLILITFLVGLLSGSYPAFMLSSFRPVSVLKGEDRSSKRSTFRTVLVVGQFTISIALIISMGVVYHQMQYFRSKKLGFNKDQVVVLPSSAQMRDNMESFKNRLMQNSNILQVTHSRLIPSDKLLNSWGGRIVDGEEPQPLNFRLAVVEVGYDFFDTYQMNLVAGRTFAKQYSTDDSAAFVLSQAAIQQLRWSQNEAIDKPLLYGNRRGRVIGVVEDMHFESLHNKIVPIIFLISESTSYKISLRISGHDIPATLAFLKNIWNEYRPDYPFEYRFLDEEIQARYESEQKLGQIFGIFSMLAVIIACLGLYGLASFAAEQRTKEIGIRKVLGAKISGILFLFSKEFVKLILLANIIAWPLAYSAMNRWLQDFAYRADLNLWIFIFAGAMALVIAIGTVSLQAVRAALSNPVEALRYE